MKTVDNSLDDLAVQRIINVPKRGIGAATIGKVEAYAAEQDIHFYDALLRRTTYRPWQGSGEDPPLYPVYPEPPLPAGIPFREGTAGEDH